MSGDVSFKGIRSITPSQESKGSDGGGANRPLLPCTRIIMAQCINTVYGGGRSKSTVMSDPLNIIKGLIRTNQMGSFGRS
jgi:hypothetical protein